MPFLLLDQQCLGCEETVQSEMLTNFNDTFCNDRRFRHQNKAFLHLEGFLN